MTDALAANDRWLRDLARRLVRDPSLAADAVQETWLSWTKSGAAGPPHRGWLRSVLHHAIGQLTRSDGRRQRREQALAAAAPPSSSSASILERLESQRAVIDAVVTLEEPYRTVILLRFYESLPPRAIATRLQLPVATVKTRLARGLERLRERLAGNGDPPVATRTFPILLPLLAPSPLTTAALPSLGLGVFTVNLVTKAVISVVAATMLIASYRWLAPGDELPTQPTHAAIEANPVASTNTNTLAPDAPRVERRDLPASPAPAPESAPPPPTADAASAELIPIRGHLFDADGSAASGLEIRFGSNAAGVPETSTVCAIDGSFQIAIAKATGTLTCSEEGYVTLYESFVDEANRDADHVVVAARALSLAGVVIDDRGAPVQGARISIPWKRLVAPRIQLDLAQATSRAIETTTREGGRFTLENAPLLPASDRLSDALLVTHDDYETARAELPRSDRDDLRIVLPTHTVVANSLSGTVVDRIGLPIARALVSLGGDALTTDSNGHFSFALRDAEKIPTELRAVALGLRAVAIPRPAEGWPPHLRVVLADDSLRIRGKVVDSAGRPREGVSVTLDLGMVLGSNPAKWTEEIAGDFDETVATDADGRFEIGGLQDRSYVLHVIDIPTLANLKSKPIAAGAENVTLVLDSERAFSTLRGRLVDRQGNGVTGAHVRCQIPYHVVETEVSTSSSNYGGRSIEVDSAGRFEIKDAPTLGLVLSIDGEGVEQKNVTVSEGFDRYDELTIPVECVCSFRLELDPIDPLARFLEIRSADDKALFVTMRTYSGWSKNNSTEIVDGRTSVLSVSERAAWAVLRRSDFSEIRRFAIRLERTDVNVLSGR